jgi:hypothetical protein
MIGFLRPNVEETSLIGRRIPIIIGCAVGFAGGSRSWVCGGALSGSGLRARERGRRWEPAARCDGAGRSCVRNARLCMGDRVRPAERGGNLADWPEDPDLPAARGRWDVAGELLGYGGRAAGVRRAGRAGPAAGVRRASCCGAASGREAGRRLLSTSLGSGSGVVGGLGVLEVVGGSAARNLDRWR